MTITAEEILYGSDVSGDASATDDVQRIISGDTVAVSAPDPMTKSEWRFNEDAMRLSGAMIGGTLGVPGGPLTSLAGAGLGQEIGGQSAQILNGLLFEDQQILPENYVAGAVDFGRKTLDAGVNVITDMMFGGLFSKVGSSVAKLPRMIFGEEYNRLAKIPTAKLAELFRSRNIPLSAGVVGGPIVKGSEIALSKLPTSSRIVQESIDETIRGISSYADETVEMAGRRLTPVASGEQLKGSVTSWVQDTRAEIGRRYVNVGKLIPKTSYVPMKNTITAIEEMTGGTVSNLSEIRNIQFPRELRNILSAINKQEDLFSDQAKTTLKRAGELTWADASKLMSGLGNMIGDPNVNIKTPKQMLKKVAAAIMTDLDDKARSLQPGAKEAWENAREFTRLFHQRKQIVSQIANSSLGRDAFDAAIRNSAKTPDILRELRGIIQSVDSKQGTKVWNDFVSTHLFEFSRAAPANQAAGDVADFSINSFFKNYTALKRSGADKILFDGVPGLRSSLDNLLKITASVKDTYRFANPSGTASQNQFMNVLTGRILLAGAGGVAGTEFSEEPTGGFVKGAAVALIAPWAFGKLITNKRFVDWLAKGSRIAPRDVNGIRSHLGRLIGITAAAPEIRDAVQEYLETYSEQNAAASQRERANQLLPSNIPFMP